jgi:choline dehydrogenase-like flavoprotein
MLSGIGPRSELEKHGIPIVQELSGVGENLKDHWFLPLNLVIKPSVPNARAFLLDPIATAKAEKQFRSNGTDPYASVFGNLPIGFIRPSQTLLQSPEFKLLPGEERQRFNNETIPAWEILTDSPPLVPEADPKDQHFTALVIGHMVQSHGSVKLASSNPVEGPLCDPKLLSHPFDRRNLIEATRSMVTIMNSEHLQKNVAAPLTMPKSLSDEDILEYARERLVTAWHMSCTAKMGVEGDEMGVVDTRFRVRGIKGLRIADMSITPFIPNCHAQAIAYQVGAMCKERLIQEYGLENGPY